MTSEELPPEKTPPLLSRELMRPLWLLGMWGVLTIMLLSGVIASPLFAHVRTLLPIFLGLTVGITLWRRLDPNDRWLRHLLLVGAPLLCTLAFAGTAHLASEVYGRTPRVQDEVNYAFMAKMFASGHLMLDAFPAQDFFIYRFFAVTPEHLFSLFQPGWPALLMLGELVGQMWLVGPLISALALVVFHRLARRVHQDERFAFWATLLMGTSIAWLFQGASMMSHMAACLFGLLGVYTAWRAHEEEGKPVWALLSGLCFGYMFTIRAASAVALSLPVIVLGVVMIARRRRPLSMAPLFGLGLLLMGGLQLLYNHHLTGHFLAFPQNVYFDMSEPIQNCHRLGIGPGIGCPYEHGPDLAREGFTWQRAWQVTLIRLRQLNLDFFGAGAFLCGLPFAFFSFKFLKRKLFLLALAASIIGLYFFYYYHGNMYGARYYFEILPYLLLLVTFGHRTLLEAIGALKLPRLGAAVTSALVLSSVLILPAHALLHGMEPLVSMYTKGWTTFKANAALEREAEARGTPTRAVIIMPNAPRSYWGGFFENAGDLDGERLYVRDWGEAMNAQLARLYPERTIYRALWNGTTFTHRPITFPESRTRDIVFEAEAKFPGVVREGGYAVPQSLAPWKTTRASRNEHLLFEKSAPGAWFELRQYLPESGSYLISATMTRGPDYGVLAFAIDGQTLEPRFDGYSAQVDSAPWRAAQPVTLERGWHTLRLTVEDRAAASRGFVAGIDQVRFSPTP